MINITTISPGVYQAELVTSSLAEAYYWQSSDGQKYFLKTGGIIDPSKCKFSFNTVNSTTITISCTSSLGEESTAELYTSAVDSDEAIYRDNYDGSITCFVPNELEGVATKFIWSAWSSGTKKVSVESTEYSIKLWLPESETYGIKLATNLEPEHKVLTIDILAPSYEITGCVGEPICYLTGFDTSAVLGLGTMTRIVAPAEYTLVESTTGSVISIKHSDESNFI